MSLPSQNDAALPRNPTTIERSKERSQRSEGETVDLLDCSGDVHVKRQVTWGMSDDVCWSSSNARFMMLSQWHSVYRILEAERRFDRPIWLKNSCGAKML
ncbi:hypothetical protein [Marivita sp.]|uniref:hypothetical protein n=1 Tax=Marivita sp. TaxID=2003365 RepID=UPI0025C64442|nr:hypothetical protein [Marivita sp.]